MLAGADVGTDLIDGHLFLSFLARRIAAGADVGTDLIDGHPIIGFPF